MMKWIFRALVLLMFVYEGIALYTPVPGDTISEIVWGVADYPLIPFLAGLLAGHFFWQRRR